MRKSSNWGARLAFNTYGLSEFHEDINKIHNKILDELEKSNNIDVICLDFAKAFDKVDHGILLNKFKKFELMA